MMLSNYFIAAGSNRSLSKLWHVCTYAVVMVSVSACFGGKRRLHFTPDKAKVNDEDYAEILSCST